MTEETTENANDSAVSGSRQERVVSRLLELEQHIRKEADFNRAWTDGRLRITRIVLRRRQPKTS